MKNIKEESLIDALSYCSLKDLPKADNHEDVWVKALALVKKKDGSESYAYVLKSKNDGCRVVKDFGTVTTIAKFLEFFPFDFLKSGFMPVFKTQKKEERISFLKRNGIDVASESITLKELDKMVVDFAVECQLLQEKDY